MIKPPSLRVPSWPDVAPEIQADFLADMETFAALLPFPIDDFEVDGSAACRRWQFHSDLDLNLATGKNWDQAKELWRKNAEQVRPALKLLRELMDKWGIRIEVSLEAPAIKDIPQKSCYRIRERVHYHPESTIKVDIRDGVATPRQDPPRLRPRQFTWSYFDLYGNQIVNQDPYPPEDVAKWAKVYGEKFQHIGDTPDTAYLK